MTSVAVSPWRVTLHAVVDVGHGVGVAGLWGSGGHAQYLLRPVLLSWRRVEMMPSTLRSPVCTALTPWRIWTRSKSRMGVIVPIKAVGGDLSHLRPIRPRRCGELGEQIAAVNAAQRELLIGRRPAAMGRLRCERRCRAEFEQGESCRKCVLRSLAPD